MGLGPENLVKQNLTRMLKAEDVMHWSSPASPYGGSNGISDKLALVCGVLIAMECKADAKKKPTPKQALFLENVELNEGKSFIVCDKETIEQVRQYIKELRRDN